jgi:hypothetical protein
MAKDSPVNDTSANTLAEAAATVQEKPMAVLGEDAGKFRIQLSKRRQAKVVVMAGKNRRGNQRDALDALEHQRATCAPNDPDGPLGRVPLSNAREGGWRGQGHRTACRFPPSSHRLDCVCLGKSMSQ